MPKYAQAAPLQVPSSIDQSSCKANYTSCLPVLTYSAISSTALCKGFRTESSLRSLRHACGVYGLYIIEYAGCMLIMSESEYGIVRTNNT